MLFGNSVSNTPHLHFPAVIRPLPFSLPSHLPIYFFNRHNWGTTFPGMMQARLSAVVLHERIESCWGVPQALFYPLSASEFSRRYHEIGAPAGGMLRAFFAVDGYYVAALQMLRLAAHPPFHPTDLAFVRLVAPLMGRALRSAFDRERANSPLDIASPEMTGVLILSPDKKVTMATPAALAWMEHLRTHEQLKATHLPTAIVSAVASLAPLAQELLPHAVLAAMPTGSLRIEASQVLEDGSLAVTLTPQQV